VQSAGGLTLVEMVVALAIMTIVVATVLPQLRLIRNSWDSNLNASETLQNGRVLMDHVRRNLSQAARITAVSESSESNGYIEFQANDGNTLRYDIAANNYVAFGPVGSESDLAGPVSRLQFTCYDAFDLDTPTTDVNTIRCVKVETTVTNAGSLGQDLTFSGQVYLRTNTLPAAGGGISELSAPWLEFDTAQGMEPALAKISDTEYLCVYRGNQDDGFACILNVNGGDWSVSKGHGIEYDGKNGITPALAQIDETKFLCAYQGDRGDGWACVLMVVSGTVNSEPGFEFDDADCIYPALCQIDTGHYLCAYDVQNNVCRVVVLTVDIVGGSIGKGPTMEFGTALSPRPALAKIDATHYLCAYQGSDLCCWAVVLTVNPGDWTVTAGTPFQLCSVYGTAPSLVRVDDTHYLCAFQGGDVLGLAVIVTVHSNDWTLSRDTAYTYYVFEPEEAAGNELCQIEGSSFLCVYRGPGTVGRATVLTVNTGDLSLSHETPFDFEPGICVSPALCQIDVGHYLCGYSGPGDDGYSGVLESMSIGVLP
jgi:type II secretory pathway pseudopilin PulG